MTPRQERFVEEYCNCYNAAEAARRAGYKHHTAASQGSRLLSKVEVKEAIQAKKYERQLTQRLSHEQACGILATIALDPKESTNSRISAVEKLARLRGWEQPREVRETVSLEVILHQIDGSSRGLPPADVRQRALDVPGKVLLPAAKPDPPGLFDLAPVAASEHETDPES